MENVECIAPPAVRRGKNSGSEFFRLERDSGNLGLWKAVPGGADVLILHLEDETGIPE